jgi:Na+-translocating ferredoxin:NAD+ oxidoreductase RnfG subunit
MNISLSQILITLFAASISGLLTAQINSRRSKKDKIAQAADKAHDQLLLEVKDLQIKLYKLEKDLTEWKEKYFEALQELIKVKAELEGTMLRLTHIEMHEDLHEDL